MLRRLLISLMCALSLLVVGVGTASAAPVSTWDSLAMCESSGNWKANTGNGYYGGLQFSHRTWIAFGGGNFARNAHGASKAEQILIAESVLAKQGWRAWPACSRAIGVR